MNDGTGKVGDRLVEAGLDIELSLRIWDAVKETDDTTRALVCLHPTPDSFVNLTFL